MTYTLRLEAGDTSDGGGEAVSGQVAAQQRREAEQRFRQALEDSLGDASLVAPIYRAYLRIVAVYGDDAASDALSEAEREILTQWRAAESAAVTAAFGPNRYMDQARFEIVLGPV